MPLPSRVLLWTEAMQGQAADGEPEVPSGEDETEIAA